MRVEKWRKGLAARLPATVIETLDLSVGDDITFILNDTGTLSARKSGNTDDLLKQLGSFRGKLPVDFRFDCYDSLRH